MGLFRFPNLQTDVEAAIQSAKNTIDTADHVLDLYLGINTRVPWTKFDSAIRYFDKFNKLYSSTSAPLVGTIKTNLLNSIDAYFHAKRHISEWCSLIMPILKVHVKLFTAHSSSKAQTQNRLLQTVLKDGIERSKVSQSELSLISKNFNQLIQTLIPLFQQFEMDYDEKNKFFQTKLFSLTHNANSTHPNQNGVDKKQAIIELKEQLEKVSKFYRILRSKINRASQNVNEMETELKTQIQHFEQLIDESTKLNHFSSITNESQFLSTLIEATQNVITKCAVYNQKPETSSTNE